MPELTYDRDAIVWNRLPSDAAYWGDDEVGFLGGLKIKVPTPKPLRRAFEKKLSAKTGMKVRLSKNATITAKHVLKSAAGVAAVAATAGAGAALSIPSTAGAAGMIGGDQLLAAAQKGGKIAQDAKNIYARTKALATKDPGARRALGILAHVNQLRKRAGIKPGERTTPVRLSKTQLASITKRVTPVPKVAVARWPAGVPKGGKWTARQFYQWLAYYEKLKAFRIYAKKGAELAAIAASVNKVRKARGLGPLRANTLVVWSRRNAGLDGAKPKPKPTTTTAPASTTAATGYFVTLQGRIRRGRFRAA